MPSPHPKFNAMIICDNSIREEGTGKVSLIGIFANINAFSFPAAHPKLTVYVNITDAEGAYKFRLDMTRVSDGKLLGRADIEAEVSDRRKPTELLLEIGPLLFERAGTYEFHFYADERYVGGKSFDVLQVERPTGEHQ